MTEFERLVRLMTFAPAGEDGNRNVYTLAKHLIKSGVVVPPCKVGDTVYFITANLIHCGKVVLIRPFIHEEYTTFHGDIEYECPDPFFCDGRMMKHKISVVFQKYGNNTIAYFSREEAEKALAERNNK